MRKLLQLRDEGEFKGAKGGGLNSTSPLTSSGRMKWRQLATSKTNCIRERHVCAIAIILVVDIGRLVTLVRGIVEDKVSALEV